TAHEAGTHEQTQQLVQALDPDKQHLAKVPQGILASGDLTSFYRTPTNSWRSRYQAAKGLCEFKLDVDKMVALERYKSHTDAEPAAEEPSMRPQDDVVLVLRDSKGPLAEVEVTVKADGQQILKDRTDAGGQLLVPFRKVTGKDVEISVAKDALGDKGELVAV